MNKILLLLLLLVSITQSESVERGIGIAAETNPTAQPLVLTVNGKKKCPWTKEEDARLLELVNKYGPGDWAMIARMVGGRTYQQCMHRYIYSVNPGIRKGPWTKEEDEALSMGYKQMGPRWALIANMIPGRTGNQCRERYSNSLNPGINKDPWTPEEDTMLTALVNKYGRKWSLISPRIPGRTDQQCMRRWGALKNKAELNEQITDAEVTPHIHTEQITDAEVSANISQQLQQSLNFLATPINTTAEGATTAEVSPPQTLEHQPISNSPATAATTAATAESSEEASDPGAEQFSEESFAWIVYYSALGDTTPINTTAEGATTAEVSPPQTLEHQPISNSPATAATTTAEVQYNSLALLSFACMSEEEQGDSYGY